ncbi:uroporphyrinogen-III synthase [Shewanella intestini]|uniref:Uroporphyrinogen-III synthase n=1 Tax=Shewanella intestini TaxID=2017544 RepID=A0ABS5I6Y5_9GAMM|nr:MULTISPECIES: uroporphyrinogen-III synthase [Shewanella]MBR9729603.1 uroporphyrinogen-III synthase [Shewanella intestini]MRG37669.1 uroporphyrinogen-III synthase [Shewanella sp. XMDDZSB0408]
MKVLLTRPAGRNQEMVDHLTQRQIDHLVTPMIEVVCSNNPFPTPTIDQTDIMIFISTNAVKYAAQLLPQPLAQSLPQSCQFYAVGQATHDALTQLGVQATPSPTSSQDSEGLLSLPQLTSLAQKQVIIVRGNGGRETLAQEITQRGGNVNYWETYTRQAIAYKTPDVYQAWIDFKIDTIVVTSGEILANLVNLLPKELFAWLRSCHIIVPSTRVKLQANELGLSYVTNANGASTPAILANLFD